MVGSNYSGYVVTLSWISNGELNLPAITRYDTDLGKSCLDHLQSVLQHLLESMP